jgi:hypothetical protein
LIIFLFDSGHGGTGFQARFWSSFVKKEELEGTLSALYTVISTKNIIFYI